MSSRLTIRWRFLPTALPTALMSAALIASPLAARAEGLSMEQAVAIALQRNHDVIAAKLEIEGAELDVVAARVYPNPILQYALGNLVLGAANTQGTMPPTRSGFLGQPVQSLGISEIVDVWSKRSARIRAANQGIEHRRLLTEDALRAIVYAVRAAFTAVVRAQSERDLAHEVADRYADTVRLSRVRYKAGDISETELRKVELEGLKYQNDVIDSDTALDLQRGELAALLGLPSAQDLPGGRLGEPDARPEFALEQLTTAALTRRPDLRAAAAARGLAEAQLGAATREVYPDISLGVNYTHSDFAVSGDNPNALALSLAVPLPIFDRNQANIGRARLDIRRANNDADRLRVQIRRDVAESVRKAARSQALLRVFEEPRAEGEGTSRGGSAPPTPRATPDAAATTTHDTGAMISRAEIALRVAERSYRAGAISLLELLESQRTYLDTRAQYLRALHDFRQAVIEVNHAVGE